MRCDPATAPQASRAGWLAGAACALAAAALVGGGCSAVLGFEDGEGGGDLGPDASGFALVDASVPDAGPEPDGGGDDPEPKCDATEWVPVLVDGNLDAQDDAWQASGGNGGPVIRITGASFNPHTEPVLVILNWGTRRELYVRQTIDLPAATKGFRVTGQRCFVATVRNQPIDDVAIEILGEDLTPLVELGAYTNEDALGTCNWLPFEFEAEADLDAGPVVFSIAATLDADTEAQSTFLFDTLALEAEVCVDE